MDTSEIPVTGIPAYWTAQREAFALIRNWETTVADPEQELVLLRRIAAHGFAARVMAAHGRPVARWISILETLGALFEAADGDDADSANPDRPPHGHDWCVHGCQPLYGMECGMCGYDGPGVWAGQTDTVAEYCCHCRARTYQDRDGICQACGRDAEGSEHTATPASPPPCCPADRDNRQGRSSASGQAPGDAGSYAAG